MKPPTLCLREFSQINPPTFYWSNIDEDPAEFINDIYMILYAMGVSSSEKVELSTYKL